MSKQAFKLVPCAVTLCRQWQSVQKLLNILRLGHAQVHPYSWSARLSRQLGRVNNPVLLLPLPNFLQGCAGVDAGQRKKAPRWQPPARKTTASAEHKSALSLPSLSGKLWTCCLEKEKQHICILKKKPPNYWILCSLCWKGFLIQQESSFLKQTMNVGMGFHMKCPQTVTHSHSHLSSDALVGFRTHTNHLYLSQGTFYIYFFYQQHI